VAFDGPAHGDSPGRTTTGPEFARAIGVAQAAVGPLAAIVAHSFGGFTSLLALSRGVSAERLVVIAAPSSVPQILEEFMRQIGLPRRAIGALVRNLERRVGATMESFDVASFAHAVKIPVLVVHDTGDVEVPYTEGVRLSELLGARLLSTKGLGHRRVLFAPEVIEAIVEFIEEGRLAHVEQRTARGGA
jgi:pimeloyl-ACP methyl ester carboxylesterase